ncbi:MAG: tetratricopeptide repeat protein [Nostoc sp. ChiQUE02]|uniref:tetratricopeptide repeat protein n=1 Tax=Nostoc sp. ChiQUE02 TaxID=3075377 RepID=UPI002AD4CE19|nr:tetratricopeptide repeat protein [Nostoc sp. ChiQUE02]MDZ8231547.1 tetratricopeptide repeat protein [Nostoc sp. ChiQUE02]
MTEEPSPSNSNNIEMNLTAYGDSKVTQVGQINAAEVKIIVDRIEPVLERLQQISQLESPGVLKAGNPNKSLAYWQGRKTEIDQIQQWLTDKNTFLIGIEGIGGTGKSMLAAKIYDEIEGFPKRFWADVSYGAGFSDLARQVLSKFGFPVPEQEAQLVDAVVKCLRSGQYLLIIDNLESLLQPDREWGSQFYGDFFNAWVEYGGNSKVIVTTREKPELPKFTWLPLKGLQVAEGIALLTTLGIRGDLEDFVKLVDGHPLLLKLVADLLKEEYPQDADLRRLADLGLGNLRQLLTDSQVVGVHRRENVGMVLVLDASFERLSELQKALLLNISVYRGAVDSKAAVAVLPGSSEKEIEEELRNLVKRSLLLEKLNGKRQFEFQPVVLEYAQYKAGDQSEAHQRAINYYLLNVKEQPWQTKEDIKEYLEIFYHRYQLENYDSAFDLLAFCDDFLKLRGYYTIQVDLYGQLIAAWGKTGERENRNYRAALNNLGVAYNYQGQYERAIQFLEQSLEIAREIDDRNTEGLPLVNLGVAYNYQGQYERAIQFLQQSLKIAREIGDRNTEGLSLMNLGNAYDYQRQYERAIQFLQQSLEIAREIGNQNTESLSLMNLGNTYFSLGQYEQAIDFFQQSLKIARQIGDRDTEGLSLANLCNPYFSLGQYEQTIEFLEQSLEIAREIGDRNGEGSALANLGNAYNYLEQYQQAIDFYQQSLDIAREIGNRNGEGSALGNLGVAYYSLGQYEQAIEFYQQSLDIAREIGDRNGEGSALGNLGIAYRSLGQYQQAIEFYQQRLNIAREIADIRGEAHSWFNLGLSLENVNRESDALGAYRNARELYQTMGLDANVQLCNNAIERISQPKTPVVSRRGFWGWLRRLWRWVCSWFRR